MSIRIAKNLIRAIIILLSVQFLLPVVAQANHFASDHSRHLLQTKETSSFSLSLYLKENNSEEETETEKSGVSAELIDFSRLEDFFIASHSFILSESLSAIQHRRQRHKVLCVFLI